MYKGKKHQVKFIEPSEESAKKTLDLVAATVHGPIVVPSVDAVSLGRNDRDTAKIKRQLPRFVAFVGPIHE
jgi:hypothetical protein